MSRNRVCFETFEVHEMIGSLNNISVSGFCSFTSHTRLHYGVRSMVLLTNSMIECELMKSKGLRKID